MSLKFCVSGLIFGVVEGETVRRGGHQLALAAVGIDPHRTVAAASVVTVGAERHAGAERGERPDRLGVLRDGQLRRARRAPLRPAQGGDGEGVGLAHGESRHGGGAVRHGEADVGTRRRHLIGFRLGDGVPFQQRGAAADIGAGLDVGLLQREDEVRACRFDGGDILLPVARERGGEGVRAAGGRREGQHMAVRLPGRGLRCRDRAVGVGHGDDQLVRPVVADVCADTDENLARVVRVDGGGGDDGRVHRAPSRARRLLRRAGGNLDLKDVVVVRAAQIVHAALIERQLGVVRAVLRVLAGGRGGLRALCVQQYDLAVIVAALHPPDLHRGGAGGLKHHGVFRRGRAAAEVDALGGGIAVVPGLGAAVHLRLGAPDDGEETVGSRRLRVAVRLRSGGERRQRGRFQDIDARVL